MTRYPKRVKIALASISLAAVLLFLTPIAAIFFVYYVPTTSDAVANAVLRNITIVTPAANQTAASRGRLAVSDEKLAQLKRGEYAALDGRELIALKKRPSGFLFLTITPDDLQGMQLDDQFFLMRKFVDAAIKLKVDAVVDASMGDHLHTYPEGLKMAEDLRANGIKRLVVFDGGHHISSLPLEAEGLLIPVTNWRGSQYLDHTFTRDAVNIPELREIMSRERIESFIARFPRISITAKTPRAMAGLAAQAIISANGEKAKSMDKPIEVTRAAGRSVERNGAVFASVEVPSGTPSAVAAERARNLIALGAGGNKPRRVYLGVTYGTSGLITSSAPPVSLESEMAGDLKDSVPNLEILSIPFSGRDIYAQKLFGEIEDVH